MHRKSKRDSNRKSPVKSAHALRYVDPHGKLGRKTTTFVPPEMREGLKSPLKENW
jgi:hypothetical protein